MGCPRKTFAHLGAVQLEHFGNKGGGRSSDADVRTLWCKKKLRNFQNLWCVRTDKEGG